MLQFMCIHSKCGGSIEFSWHCSQLQGTSAKTTWTKPFFQENGSQSGTSGAGCGPRYAQSNPALASTGYALMWVLSLNRASGAATSSQGCSTHWPVSSNRQP